MSDSDRIRAIEDRFAIQDLISNFCQLADTRRLDILTDETYTADAVLDYGSKRMTGRDEIHAFYNSFEGTMFATAHIVGNPLVQIDGDSAIALHRVMGFHWHAQKSEIVEIVPANEVMMGGYQDRLRRTPAGWRIHERIIVQFGTGLGVGDVKPPFDEMMRKLLPRKAKWPF
jgi:hypothetical protein